MIRHFSSNVIRVHRGSYSIGPAHFAFEVTKRYLAAVAAHNLGRLMFKLFGIGKPRMGRRAAWVVAYPST